MTWSAGMRWRWGGMAELGGGGRGTLAQGEGALGGCFVWAWEMRVR